MSATTVRIRPLILPNSIFSGLHNYSLSSLPAHSGTSVLFTHVQYFILVVFQVWHYVFQPTSTVHCNTLLHFYNHSFWWPNWSNAIFVFLQILFLVLRRIPDKIIYYIFFYTSYLLLLVLVYCPIIFVEMCLWCQLFSLRAINSAAATGLNSSL